MTIFYELKKMLLKRNGWIIILLALILKIIMLAVSPKMTYFNIKMEENKAQFISYMEILSGDLTEEKSEYISSEEERFSDIEEENERILDSYINGKTDELSFLEHLKEHDLAMEQKEAFSVVQGQYQSALTNEKSYFSYCNGWAFLLGCSSGDWLLIITIFLLAVPFVSSEYTGGMADLLDTTAKGKTRLYLSKYTAIMIVTAAVTVLFSLSELLYSGLKYGLPDAGYPIQTISQFASSEYNITMSEGVVFIWLNRIFGMMFLSAIVFFFVCKVKKPLPALFVGISSVLLPGLLLSRSRLLYQLPLPVAFLNSAGFLRSRFETSYMSGTYIHLSHAAYMQTLIISAVFLILFSVFSIFRFKIQKLKFTTLLYCFILVLSGCEGRQYSDDNAIYNMHGAYEIINNSRYIFQFDNNRLFMTDKQNEEQIEIIRDPFFDDTTTILYSSMFADENYFYRCEQIKSSSLDRRTIYREQIVRTDLSDFSEDIIYTNNVLEDANGAYLGLGEYLPYDIPDECSIFSFVVINESIYLEMTDGIYSCMIGDDKPAKLTKETIQLGEWSYTDNTIYYIDELYRLHRLTIDSGIDEIISEKIASGLFITDDSIYIRSLSDGGALIKQSISDNSCETIVEKTNSCFSVDNNIVYYTDPLNNSRLCRLNLTSSETTVISESTCSYVYPITGCDYFYYNANNGTGEYCLFKYSLANE